MGPFEEARALSSVAAFHAQFKVPVLDTPQIPSAARCALRVSLLQEELDELKAAIAADDLTEVGDAFADLQYVLAGAVHEFGMGGRFAAMFDDVHRSNMSKACKSLEEAEATVKYYAEERNMEARIEEPDSGWLVYRVPDSKVLKSVNFSQPRIGAILGVVQDEN